MSSNFFFENHSFYEIIWKNIVQPDRTQIIVWRMRILCWIPTAANTLRICDIYYYARQQLLHERASMLHYTYIACLVLLIIPMINQCCRTQIIKFLVTKYFCPFSPFLQIISQYFSWIIPHLHWQIRVLQSPSCRLLSCKSDKSFTLTL